MDFKAFNEEYGLIETSNTQKTGTCIMGKMRKDRAPIKWNKRFVYPKSQRSLVQGKRGSGS